MPSPEKVPPAQLKDENDRALRSASPAIKRPASDMGAQDREVHSTEVEMGDVEGQTPGPAPSDPGTDSRLKQDNGKRLRGAEALNAVDAHESNPKSSSQFQSSEDSSSVLTDSLVLSPSKTSTTATSNTPSMYEPSVPADELPPIDEQVQRVITLANEEVRDKKKGYVISNKWLRRVQARSSFPQDGRAVEKAATEGPVGPVENSDIAMIIEEQGHLKDEAGEKFVELRPNLTLNEDYEVLPQQAWDLILSWYGLARTSPIITRYAHATSDAEVPSVMYELHPPVWSFLKVPATHSLQTQREKDLPPQRMSDSRYNQFQEWLKKAKELVGIELSTKVRVWRVLGGLKSTSASGILTPAASRSASPAPGAELIASAGDRMLLDVNTFAALPIGEHRELLEVKDYTNDTKYNGKVTLATLGLGRNDVIVLEEQSRKNEEWPSETIKLSLNKNLAVKSRNLTSSGRTSPAPGMMTRGRQRRDGRPKGIMGLSNLGNTCYMNSALQSIRSVEELTQYFILGKWKQDLNVGNPLGHHGNVARAYADLIQQIYGDGTGSSCNPSKFKSTIGKYGPSFAGYGQQDSQEFLLFLLDGLQEDLNRIQKKPYIEKPDSTDEMVHDTKALKEFADKNWEIYKARNDSVITDLFAGMYKSTVTCPVCDKVSIIFDPFNNLTLQLPIENNWTKEIIYFPLHQRPYRIDVDIDKMSTFRAVKEFIAKRTHHDPDKMILAEMYKHKFYRTYNNGDTIAETNIGEPDVLCMYELEDVPTNYNPNRKKKSAYVFSPRDEDDLVALDSPEADKLLVPVFHRLVKRGERRVSRTFFGQPSYLIIDRKDSASYERVLKKVLRLANNMTTTNIFEEDDQQNNEAATPEDSDTVIMTDDGSSSDPKAASIQGEDGIVDISMREASQAPGGDEMDTDMGSPRILQPGVAVPVPLQNLFDIRLVATGEGIPTGWNSIEEHKEFAEITDRIPQEIPSTARTGEDDASSESSSSGELSDVPYRATGPGNESGSESGRSAEPKSEDESDDGLPPPASEIIKDTRGMRNRANKKTYSRRDRRKQQAMANQPSRGQPRQQIPPQILSATKSKVASSTRTALIRPGEALVLDWDADAYDALFGGNDSTDDGEMRGCPTWKQLELLEDPELVKKRSIRLNRKKNGVSLEDCLNEFGKEETLSEQNAWYCPRCKEHRRARKMFELWKAPDILVMHLKRFSSNRSFRDKLEVRVDYPVEGLDLSSMVRDQADGKNLIYDLIAVDNHYGGLGGGHYTAYAKNFINGNWYDYNDSHVSQKDASSVVTSAAYLLFYRRRTESPLGGTSLSQLLTEVEADSEDNAGSRDPSPSGEGRRLGDSSHNGLSSAYPVGPVRLVGDGGLGAMERDLSQEEGSPLRPTARTASSEELPSYEVAFHGDREMLLDAEDEAIDVTEPSNWLQPSWGFEALNSGTAARANSVDDLDNSSTRGQGDSPDISLSDLRDDDDPIMHSEDLDEYNRGMRESAPPPDISVGIGGAQHNDDEDDGMLPVLELRSDPSGEMAFTTVKDKTG